MRAISDDPDPLIYFSAVRSDPNSGDTFVFQGRKADYHETLFDGLRVYHNPHAIYPLDWRVFEEPGAYQAVCVNSETHEWKYWMDRPPLAARSLITLNIPDEDDIETLRREAADSPKAGWHKLQFTQSVISEFAAFHARDGESNSPSSP